MNDNLVTSLGGLKFIERWEGCVLTPYKDVAGLRTIGIGYLIKPTDNFPDGVAITKEKAYDLLREEVKKCENSIKTNIKVQLTQNMFDALVSFGFNCGVGVYSSSGVARETNASNFSKVPERLLDWCKATVNGQKTIVKGLYDRRKAEGDLFLLDSGISPVFGPTCVKPAVSWDKSSITDAQIKLKKLGMYQGKIDGIWGAVTSSAITSFAKNAGIPLFDPASPTQALFDAIKKI
jgi:lysozyme